MRLHDTQIERALALLGGFSGKELSKEDWMEAGNENLVLRGEMAYELGGGSLPALSGHFFSSSAIDINEDQIWLYGKDLSELDRDTPYARLTFLKVGDEGLGGKEAIFTNIRKIEYSRYQVQPKGYMTRISGASGREPVRIGERALKEGLGFAKAGSQFIKAYRGHPQVLAVNVVFVTLPDFSFDGLRDIISQTEQITRSLDLLSKNPKIDCAECNLKPVCDEVEGMKELHFAR